MVMAAVAVAAVSARQQVQAADDAAARVDALVATGLDAACLALRRSAAASGTQSQGDSRTPAGSWRVEWEPAPPTPGGQWPGVSLRVVGARGSATRTVHLSVELRRECFAAGVVSAHDAELEAPVRVTGSGLYCGGCVRGREWLSFPAQLVAGESLPAIDRVHGDLWPVPGVHALGGVFAFGQEIHAGEPPTSYESDTDTHTGGPPVDALVAPPNPAWWVTAREQQVDASGALEDGTLHLDRLPVSAPAGGGAVAAGYVVWLPPSADAETVVEGVRPPGACPIVVAAPGDLVLGTSATTTSLAGSVVVGGSLDVRGPVSIVGSAFAGTMHVGAALDSRSAVGLADASADRGVPAGRRGPRPWLSGREWMGSRESYEPAPGRM